MRGDNGTVDPGAPPVTLADRLFDILQRHLLETPSEASFHDAYAIGVEDAIGAARRLHRWLVAGPDVIERLAPPTLPLETGLVARYCAMELATVASLLRAAAAGAEHVQPSRATMLRAILATEEARRHLEDVAGSR